ETRELRRSKVVRPKVSNLWPLGHPPGGDSKCGYSILVAIVHEIPNITAIKLRRSLGCNNNHLINRKLRTFMSQKLKNRRISEYQQAQLDIIIVPYLTYGSSVYELLNDIVQRL